jgi:hypothetical protein
LADFDDLLRTSFDVDFGASLMPSLRQFDGNSIQFAPPSNFKY